jgi:hypothetical protein
MPPSTLSPNDWLERCRGNFKVTGGDIDSANRPPNLDLRRLPLEFARRELYSPSDTHLIRFEVSR